ncbi:MAG: 3-methyl-2-oxobutanoate dehydrogenase subunit VorB [Clostridia bacterium]|nr:3-methyl-2-oxobutanoate dehydrogenase subunit VorB [Clostridia bacterium]
MAEKVLMKGNEAIAEAAIRAGCRHFFGYPITPQTEVSAYMAKKMPKIGGVFLQAESEIAAANMVLGAASAGVRTMTSSSSPGISLKQEAISYIIGSDLPCVILNIQRGGPGLGGIQPSQADYFQATRSPGHGDAHMLVFAPASVQEMVTLVTDAFDLADKYRMPAMILGDGALGQMMEPVVFEDKEITPPEKPWATNGHENKRAHNIVNSLYIQPDELERIVKERFEKYEEIKKNETRVENFMTDDADVIVVAYGIAARVAKSAVRNARAAGIKAGLIRPITLWPFPAEAIKEKADKVKAFLTVELSMGQMVEDVKLAAEFKAPVEFFGRTGGMVPTTDEVFNEIVRLNGGNK